MIKLYAKVKSLSPKAQAVGPDINPNWQPWMAWLQQEKLPKLFYYRLDSNYR